MPDPIFFEGAVVARSAVGQDRVSIALYDGSIEHGEPGAMVAVLECRDETARSLAAALGSALDDAV